MIHYIPVTIIQIKRVQKPTKVSGYLHGKGRRCPVHRCMVDRLADGLFYCAQCGMEYGLVGSDLRPYDDNVRARGMQIFGEGRGR
jgi:hypothetical protein